MNSEIERAYVKALDLLSYRERSQDELRRGLLRRGYDGETVEAVLALLLEEGLADDDRYAHNLIRQGMVIKPCGKRRLRHDLQRRGIDEEIIERNLEQDYADEEEPLLAAELVRSRLPRLAAVPPGKRYQRLAGYLARRGFRYETIRRVLKDAGLDLPRCLLDTSTADELQ